MDITSFVAGLQAGVGNGGSDVLNSVLDRSITELVSNVQSIGERALYGCEALTNVRLPKATSLMPYALYGCKALTNIYLPEATSIGEYSMTRCEALRSVHLPKATILGRNALNGCIALTDVYAQEATRIENSTFSGCSSLTTAYFPKVGYINQYAFNNCYSLRSVILGSTSVCTLGHRGAFTNCYHFFGSVNSTYNPNGDKDGYVYVPSALVESYKVAPVWSDISHIFRALEDYTVDGTITGELDPNKI